MTPILCGHAYLPRQSWSGSLAHYCHAGAPAAGAVGRGPRGTNRRGAAKVGTKARAGPGPRVRPDPPDARAQGRGRHHRANAVRSTAAGAS